MNQSKSFSAVLDHVSDGVYMVDTQRRIGYWNKAAERITGFTAAEVLDRCCSDNILTHVDAKGIGLCNSLCPLAHSLADGRERQAVVFLHHKKGHRVPVHIGVQVLRSPKGKLLGAVETFRECSDVIALRSTIEQLKQWGCLDLESGLASRKVTEMKLEQRIQEIRRLGWPFGVLLVEIDLLDNVRKTFGKQGVSTAIRIAAQSVQNSLRAMDSVGRWDDRQFLAVVTNTTAAELEPVAERVRTIVESAYAQLPAGSLQVTISIGAATANERSTQRSLLRQANANLYASRTSGRNRVTVS